MPDYSQSKIYKIVDNTNGNVYIGSTTKKYLCSRLSEHRADVARYEEGRLNMCSSYSIIKNGNYAMVLIETFPCQDKTQLRFRERFHIENEPNCINIQRSIRTEEDTKNDMKERYKNLPYEEKKAIYEAKKVKITCKCGVELSVGIIWNRHNKTKKHVEYLNSIST